LRPCGRNAAICDRRQRFFFVCHPEVAAGTEGSLPWFMSPILEQFDIIGEILRRLARFKDDTWESRGMRFNVSPAPTERS
jgi:hypothetical protein